ncbi:Cyclin-B2-3 [Capsicum baccatum]|uniref:Cyclin-B2-3 n=1 Tax=Capsicum baccatum TaxID=33114 RepID=A0A2G2VZ93_CAPBA|nr:Cyclin-B2-3 [Capsicum baccatum]
MNSTHIEAAASTVIAPTPLCIFTVNSILLRIELFRNAPSPTPGPAPETSPAPTPTEDASSPTSMMSPPAPPTSSPAGDSDDGPAAYLENSTMGKKKNVAFDNLSSLNTDFWAFIEYGFNTSKCAKNIYVKGKDVLPECLVFGSCVVDSKEWFYSLAPYYRPLNNTITNPPILVAPIRNETKDCIIIDAEYYKATGYSDVPMFMQHTEAMIEKINRMVHYKFELMEETLYLTMNLIDKFLAIQLVIRKKLQLVGITGLLLACKYEEISVPVVEDLILISDKAYARKKVLEMEKLMVNALQFNITVPTTYVFMWRFLKASQSDKKVELVSFFLIELCLVEYEMLRFPPSRLVAVFIAQCTIGVSRKWNATCRKYSSYGKNQIL